MVIDISHPGETKRQEHSDGWSVIKNVKSRLRGIRWEEMQQ